MRIINIWEHNGWGNSIRWLDWDNRRLSGHLSTPPSVGDEVRSKMDTGKIARFLITAVKRLEDPPDMFFANVSDIGYLEVDA